MKKVEDHLLSILIDIKVEMHSHISPQFKKKRIDATMEASGVTP